MHVAHKCDSKKCAAGKAEGKRAGTFWVNGEFKGEEKPPTMNRSRSGAIEARENGEAVSHGQKPR